jgi:hypothetical protein
LIAGMAEAPFTRFCPQSIPSLILYQNYVG